MLTRTSVKNFPDKHKAMDYILGLPEDTIIRVYTFYLHDDTKSDMVQVCTYRNDTSYPMESMGRQG